MQKKTSKKVPDRITYAQKKLLAIVEERNLQKWIYENNLDASHSLLFLLAFGERQPTYKFMSSMTHIIAPIEWLFFTDEELPYKPRLLPKWDTSKTSVFFARHKYDYEDVAKKYGLSKTVARNIFVDRITAPSIAFIRACCDINDPSDFFSEATQKDEAEFYVPDAGDIINIKEKLYLAVSKKAFSKETGIFFACPIISTKVDSSRMESFSNASSARPVFIEKAKSPVLKKALDELKSFFW